MTKEPEERPRIAVWTDLDLQKELNLRVGGKVTLLAWVDSDSGALHMKTVGEDGEGEVYFHNADGVVTKLK